MRATGVAQSREVVSLPSSRVATPVGWVQPTGATRALTHARRSAREPLSIIQACSGAETMNDWTTYWQQAQRLKTPADRRQELEKLLDAPWRTLLRIVKENRSLVSRSPRLPARDRSTRFFFAGGTRKNVMIDVVDIYVRQSRKRPIVEQLLICQEVRVSLTPHSYLIREQVLAAAGNLGGMRVVNVDEFLCGRMDGAPVFVEDFEQCIPRLKEYKYRGLPIKCYWTSRGLRLRHWKRQLQVLSGDDLVLALRELWELLGLAKLTDEVRNEIQETLLPEWHKLKDSSEPQISLPSTHLMNLFR